jgi:dephospho-CoA kinase|tara:strand:+ start:79 stop:822 length:744 start_codon:yes stop_codon:yes gene_type:complete
MKSFSQYITEKPLSHKQNLDEGVFDPGIFKAIFLAGGPGSGKSYVAGKTTRGLGLKLINSDDTLERLLIKHNVPLDFATMSPAQTAQKDTLRTRAKELTFGQMKVKKFKGKGALDHYIHGRLGLVIDGTGREFDDIHRQASYLKNIGYDTYMIFVNTSEQVALERNAARPRKLKPEMVKQMWLAVQQNIGRFQAYFRPSNFIIIDNNNAKEDAFNKVSKRIRGLVKKKITNPVAQQWIAAQMQARRR